MHQERAPAEGGGGQGHLTGSPGPEGVEDAQGRLARLPVRNIGHHGARVDLQSKAGRAIGDGSPGPLRVRLDGGERTLAVWCPGSDRMRMRFMFTDPVERKGWIRAVDRLM